MEHIVKRQEEVVSYLFEVAQRTKYPLGTFFKSILLFELIEAGTMDFKDISNPKIQEIMENIYQDYLDDPELFLINEDILMPLSNLITKTLKGQNV